LSFSFLYFVATEPTRNRVRAAPCSSSVGTGWELRLSASSCRRGIGLLRWKGEQTTEFASNGELPGGREMNGGGKGEENEQKMGVRGGSVLRTCPTAPPACLAAFHSARVACHGCGQPANRHGARRSTVAPPSPPPYSCCPPGYSCSPFSIAAAHPILAGHPDILAPHSPRYSCWLPPRRQSNCMHLYMHIHSTYSSRAEQHSARQPLYLHLGDSRIQAPNDGQTDRRKVALLPARFAALPANHSARRRGHAEGRQNPVGVQLSMCNVLVHIANRDCCRIDCWLAMCSAYVSLKPTTPTHADQAVRADWDRSMQSVRFDHIM